MKHTTLTIPRHLDPKLYQRVKATIETFGGRRDKKTKTHLFAPQPRPELGIHSARSFLASIEPLPADAPRAKRKIEKRSARVTNVHRLWKLLAPIIIRRRKADCGEDIVKKKTVNIRLNPGTAQQAVYKHHLDHPPVAAKGRSATRSKLDRRVQIGMQLGNLRKAALCPHDDELAQVVTGVKGPSKSWTDMNPKLFAALTLTADLLDIGKQLLVGSPFRAFNGALQRRLAEAGVATVLLDGTVPPDQRGDLAARFKRFEYSVCIAGLEAMGEGHSFSQASHLLMPSRSWALDTNVQFPDRIWRLDSPEDVTVYHMILTNTVDEVLEALYGDKLGSSQIVLDGMLNEETVEEADTARLLADAVRGFDPAAPTTDEQELERSWPSLRQRLALSEVRFREWHPPIAALRIADCGLRNVTSAEVAGAVAAISLASPSATAVHLARMKAKLRQRRHG